MNNKNKIMRFAKVAVCAVVVFAAISASKNVLKAKNTFVAERLISIDEKAAVIASMLEKNYIGDFENTDLSDEMYAGMVNAMGDPYTVYLTKEQMSNFLSDTNGTISGIGIVISVDNDRCIVNEVLEGSPAEKAGVKSGDIITAVDGESAEGKTIVEISALTKGKAGTSVRLEVLREGKKLSFDIHRSSIDLQYVKSKIDGDIGYIKITEFAKVTSEQFDKALEELINKNINGLVIDLRNNPGGIIDVAAHIANRLLPDTEIAYTVDKNGVRNDFKSDAEYVDIPLVILVNGSSASASELLAGAIQDNKRGAIIGEQTFGKGIVQGLYSLGDGSGIKITIQKYYTPNGVCIHGVGITPDYKVDSDDLSALDNDKQYMKAKEILKKD